MVSGSDEHGTPITVTAEQDGVSPQDVVDEYHAINTKALLDLGCTWMPNVDLEALIMVVHCSTGPVIQGIRKKSKRIFVYFTTLDSLKKEPCSNITKFTRKVVDVSSLIDTLRVPAVMWCRWCAWRPMRRLWSDI